jgi:hypothetical protein
MTFRCWSMARHKIYYKGRTWWLPPSPGLGESCESMFTHGSSMHQKCSNYALTNLLFGLCKSMWVIDLLVTLLKPHPRAPTRPSTPKVIRTRECAPIPYSFVVFTLNSHLSLSRSFEAHEVRKLGGPWIICTWPLHK